MSTSLVPVVPIAPALNTLAMRQAIRDFEAYLAQFPEAVHGDSALFPLKHSFAEGLYVREMFLPRGSIVVGKIHKHAHPNFLMQGEVLVFTEGGGYQHLCAPLAMISQPGTKRVVKVLADTIWIVVHDVGAERDLEKIEDLVIAPTYDDLQVYLEGLADPQKALRDHEAHFLDEGG